MAEKKPIPTIAQIITGVIIIIILMVIALPRFIKWTEGSVIANEASNLFYDLGLAKKHGGSKQAQGVGGIPGNIRIPDL